MTGSSTKLRPVAREPGDEIQHPKQITVEKRGFVPWRGSGRGLNAAEKVNVNDDRRRS